MRLSPLYYSILHRPFFILPRTAEAESLVVMKLLEHDPGQYGRKICSDDDPPRLVTVAPGGRAVMRTSADLGESASDGSLEQGTVAIIPLRGTMTKEGTLCSYGTEELAGQLLDAVGHDEIIGVVLDIDSGGGCVDAIAPLTQAIARSQSMGKPVVASCDLCASAAYYVVCHCDAIIANNDISSEFGSIGVMTQLADYAGYYEKAGIKLHHIYSNLSTHKNAPFEAALKGDYKAIKEEELDPLARQFQETVKAHREKLDQETEGVLSGRMFMSDAALRIGLIDAVGTLSTAVDEVRRRAAAAQLSAYSRSL